MIKCGKKWIIWVLALILTAAVLPIQRVEAAAASLSRTSSYVTTITSGRSFTLTLSVDGRNIQGMEAELDYDPALLELTGCGDPRTNWSIDMNGSKVMAYGASNPINSNAQVMTLTFRVQDGVAADTRLSVRVCDGATTDGDRETALTESAWTGYVTYVMGDVTEDGRLDAADVTALAKHVGRRKTLSVSAQVLADVNNDGDIGKKDLTALLRFVSGITERMG